MPFTGDETQLILRAIREDKPFRTKFAQVADEVVDKVYTYFTNPNCTCKSALIDWTNKNEQKTRELINTNSELFEKLKQTPTAPAAAPVQVANRAVPQPAQPTTVTPATTPPPAQVPANVKIGETIAIEPSPEAYKKLFETIKTERWVFRGIQVIPGEDNGKDVWFILFY